MKLLTVTLVVLFVALGSAQPTQEPASELPTTAPTITAPPTTAPPTTAPPTTAPPTTAPPTTAPPTTAPPTTAPPTTAPPTTAAPTTAPPTTAAPTTAAPTTAAPTPTTYVVTKDGKDCILAQLDVTFSGKYELKNKSMMEFEYPMPENAVVDLNSSRCGTENKSAIMVLTFGNNDTFTLQFTMDSAANTFQLSAATASLEHNGAHFPDSSQTGSVEYGGVPGKVFFRADLGRSFKCFSPEEIPFTTDDFKFTFTKLRLQPFVTDDKFGEESPCPGDEAPSHWYLTNGKGAYCLLADFQVTFTGSYEKKNKKPGSFSYILPQTATVDKVKSKCGSAGDANAGTVDAVLVLTLLNGDTFTQVFEADTKTHKFTLSNATAALKHDGAHFPDSIDAGKVVTYGGAVPKPPFQTGLGSYYKCSSMEKVDFGSKDNFALTYTDLKIQPFEVNNTFGNMDQCKADTPTIKPAEPPVGNWTIYYEKRKCMLMQFGAQFIISYVMGNSTKSKAGFYLPNGTVQTTNSKCTNKSATFVASFAPGLKTPANDWVMSLKFTMDSNKNYALTNFTLEYDLDADHFPDVNVTTPVTRMTAFNDTKRYSTVSGSYYLCNADQDIKAGGSVLATFTKMKLQPFAQTVKGGGLGTASDCSADNTVSNIVPIAVGCALAGLVIIVLIAYLIGRSRTNRSGYQSV